MSDESKRTTPLGLFNYARSYFRSAEYLHAAKLELTHPSAPATFLFYHAIEVYLKAFLLSQKLTLKSLKAIGHHVDKAGEAAVKHGLTLSDEDKEVIELIGDGDTVINARYIVIGAFSRPSEDALSRTCQSLDNSVGKKLVELGIPVREEHMKSPTGVAKIDVHFERRAPYEVSDIQGERVLSTVRIGIRNSGNGPLSNCKVYVEKMSPIDNLVNRLPMLLEGGGFTLRHDDPEKFVDIASQWNHVDKFRFIAPYYGAFAETLNYIDDRILRTIVVKADAFECQRSATFEIWTDASKTLHMNFIGYTS
jgi:hypothetical protein